MTVAAVPVEMSIPAPPEPTDNDMARLSALVALLVRADFLVGVGGTPRHKTDDSSGIQVLLKS
jgi:hypothetical protein